MCGLLKRPFLTVPDIGFAYLPEYIGKGYGFEAATALMAHVTSEKLFKKIMAFCKPENLASAGLLLKLGFVQEDDLFVEDDLVPKKLFSYDCF